MNTTSKIIISILPLVLCAPLSVFATEIRLDPHRVEVKIGEQFIVDVVAHSQAQLNAVEGQLMFPEDMLQVVEIRDGNSAVNFWVEKPQSILPSTIVFSGITPGGWSGPNNLIFTVVFEAKKDGTVPIIFQGVHALRNDGAGTEELISLHNVEIVVKSGDSKDRKESFTDTEPPEDFTPIISEDKNLFEGKYVALFSTQDKGSGIDKYEVKEFRFAFLPFLSSWDRAESPYVLKDQELKSHIVIKATDNLDNERITTVAPRYSFSWYDYLSVIGILVIALAFCVFVFKILWRKK